ncbi:MAG TPA: dTMP kinase [Gemmataceae bacterium]|nr:dTMP kinase [Gemmataceae bacterium]
MPRGIFIAFEGIDGAGKTTQVDRLADVLGQAGISFVRSKEPTSGPWGQKIRRSAEDGRLTFDEELTAFIEDRKEHLRDVIQPALERGDVVILDRYFYSTIAYQGSRSGDFERVARIMFANAPDPDAVILLDVDPAVGISRIRKRGDAPNEFEGLDNLIKVREVFRKLAVSHKNITMIDASPEEATVRKSVLSVLVNGIFSDRSNNLRPGSLPMLKRYLSELP